MTKHQTDVVGEQILPARHSKHGEFAENSRATWAILRALQAERNWPTMTDGQKHALYMIAHKMARIAAGDPAEPDHWDDIAGYARCVADRIREPVTPYDAGDLYGSLAVGWGVGREDAKKRAYVAAYSAREGRALTVAETDELLEKLAAERHSRTAGARVPPDEGTGSAGGTAAASAPGTDATGEYLDGGPAPADWYGTSDAAADESVALRPGTPADEGQHGPWSEAAVEAEVTDEEMEEALAELQTPALGDAPAAAAPRPRRPQRRY